MLFLSIYIFLCGLGLMTLGIVGRIRISQLFPELVPEFAKYEYIDLVPLLILFYNSVIILAVPLVCLSITIIRSWNAFIINFIIWIGFLTYTDYLLKKLRKTLKTKGLKLRTLHNRIKDRETFQLENEFINTIFRDAKIHQTNKDHKNSEGLQEPNQ